MTQRAYDDMAGRYLVPSEGVSLANLGVPPYSPPAEDWDDKYSVSSGSADELSRFGAMSPAASGIEPPRGISFADMVRTISPVAEPGTWREDNSAPFWIPDDPRALSGPSFDDLVRTIDPSADPDVWRDDTSASPYAAWETSDRYAVPYDPHAAAPGAFRIPDLPEDATGWGLRENLLASADDIVPVLLASRWGRDMLVKVWKAIGGVPGRRPDGPPATAPSGRRRDSLGTPPGPPRNTPAVIEGRPYSAHALDSMQDRGIPPRVVEHTIRTNRPLPDRDPGVSRYFNEEHRFFVVVNEKTKNVITVKFVKE